LTKTVDETIAKLLLKSDSKNAQRSIQFLERYLPNALPVSEAVSEALQSLATRFSEENDFAAAQRQVDEWASSRPTVAKGQLELLDQASLIGTPVGGDELGVLKAQLEIANSVIARTLLLQKIWRDFVLGIVEILRVRMTPSFGFLRIQAESVGLLSVMGAHADVGGEWLRAISAEEGLTFYKKYRKDVAAAIAKLKLGELFDQGSNGFFHPRAFGVTPSLLASTDSAKAGELGLSFQEFESHYQMAAWLGAFIKSQLLVRDAIAMAIPELTVRRTVHDDYLEVRAKALQEKAAALFVQNRSSGPWSGK
jgi:hypothetical protein